MWRGSNHREKMKEEKRKKVHLHTVSIERNINVTKLFDGAKMCHRHSIALR